MSAFFIPPTIPAATVDPALSARTFVNNPHLAVALAQLQAHKAQPASSSDTPLTYAYLYQVETKTGSGITSETIHVAANDICDAIQKAIAQLSATHPDGIRVVACRELKKRGAA